MPPGGIMGRRRRIRQRLAVLPKDFRRAMERGNRSTDAVGVVTVPIAWPVRYRPDPDGRRRC